MMNVNKDKIILDLCGGTGSWSKPYVEAGYDVRVITLPDYDVRTYEPPKNVYGILAAPPCTEFSIAKGNKPRDFETGLEIVQACLKIIWKCRLDGNLKFWALENPRGFLRQFLGIPKFTFEHWQYDINNNNYKATDLWGYYKIPKPIRNNRPHNPAPKKGHGIMLWKFDCPDEYKYLGLDKAAIRAITPIEFAKAFYKANK